MNVELVAVGSELLLGAVVNTNAAWLARELAAAGIAVSAGVEVGDDVVALAAVLRTALERADAVVVTGGLGPTQDDITREALAAAAGVALHRDAALVAGVRARYAERGRAVPELALQQADVPAGGVALANDRGSAPGLLLPVGERVVFALPGVPHEMKAMFLASVLPELRRRSGAPAALLTRAIGVAGMGESDVAAALAGLADQLAATGNPVLAFLASAGLVRVRLTARASSEEQAGQLLAGPVAQVRAALGAAVFSDDGASLEAVVHRRLLARDATVAAAESLTGGLLGAALSATPGASATLRGSLVCYATDLKASLAGVAEELLAADGPVSPRVAAALAAGARARLGATYGLATTGVAGPTEQGGAAVGTVHVGLAGPDGGRVSSLSLPGDREHVRSRAVLAALDLLRRQLEFDTPWDVELP